MALKKNKKKPTWVSSVPMKMRRIRVRSLLAGCISCLRCVRTSGLTCRSSPFASPRTADPFLPARWNSLDSFYGLLLWLLLSPAYYLIPQQPSSRKICFTESSLCIFSSYRSLSSVPLPFALRGCTYLSPRRAVLNIGLKTRKHRPIHTARKKTCTPFLPKLYLPASSCRVSSRWKNESDGAVHGAEAEVASPREGDLKIGKRAGRKMPF